MICTTCGADNPSQLTFCQECGQRLAPRVAPATPPTGLALASPAPQPGAQTQALAQVQALAQAPTVAAPAPAPVPAGPTSSGARQRPAAPPVSFGRRSDSGRPASATGPSPAAVMCRLCGAQNHTGVRFCVTCGQAFAEGAAPVATQPDMLKTVLDLRPPNEAAASAPVPAGPIAPARVVELGTTSAVPMQRICARCRGASDGTGQFCRFCGASLADAQSFPASSALAPAPPLAPTPPAPPVVPVLPVSVLPVPGLVGSPAYAPGPAAVATQAPPAAQAFVTRARLVLIGRDGGEGPTYPLGESTDIGRTEGHLLIAEDRYISPRHARIASRGGAFYLQDLQSTNGIFMRIPFERAAGAAGAAAGASPGPGQGPNMAPGEQPLADQDLFLVGQQVLRFEVVKTPEEGFGVASENGTLLFGTPASPRHARLSQRTVEGLVRDVFHVRKNETVIGREQGDIVFTEDPFLSRRHCAVRVQGGSGGQARSFALADLGSSNGTFLQVRDEIRLRQGDHFRIGQQLFRFDT